jgi:hypothetical protein
MLEDSVLLAKPTLDVVDHGDELELEHTIDHSGLNLSHYDY